MQAGFETSLMEELKFLLGIQKQQHPEATYIHQERREAEYVSTSMCSTQMLWKKHQPEDYHTNESNLSIFLIRLLLIH